ncbi:MAG TPA: hypothetical protein VE992_03090 [Solirubrobacteraceae bacterium]|nr:hypothetical protein [Solirubrobacteraceae bacterium]
MAYLVAGAAAALALLVEQIWSQRLWFTFSALGFWLIRLIPEAGAGMILTGIVRHVPKGVLSINGILLGAIAGVAAPRVARASLPVKDHNVNLFNLAYKRVTEWLDENIDAHSAEAQRVYVNEVVRPAAAAGRIRVNEVSHAFQEHIDGRRGISPVERADRLGWISEIERDEIDDEEKVATLFLRAWQIGAYVSMRGLLKRLPRRRLWLPAKATRASRQGQRSRNEDPPA